MTARFLFQQIELQATSLCNLNCSYCYLPERRVPKRMLPEVAARVAEMLEGLPRVAQPQAVTWHCGEPLACGIEHFRELLRPFAALEASKRIRHVIQTNATLINEDWCELFRAHDFNVGVSIDGPAWANRERLDWAGHETWERTMRGIAQLRAAEIPFNVIAVITPETLGRARELYDFFCDLGCWALSINIEERAGVNIRRSLVDDSAAVAQFWSDLTEAWKARPALKIREFDLIFLWEKGIIPSDEIRTHLLPAVSWDGDVVVLAPEFLQIPGGRYGSFIVGNVLNEPLIRIISRAKQAPYVLDFMRGQEACRESCRYFSSCRGGHASHRFFELGTTAATETAFCRHSRQRLFDVMVERLSLHSPHQANMAR